MPNLAFLFLLITAYSTSYGQQSAFANDGEGKPIYFSRSNYTADGSPYLYDDYRIAEITLANGTVYEHVNAKLNLLENMILYKNAEGVEMQAIIPIKKMKFLAFTNAENEYFNQKIIESSGLNINQTGATLYETMAEGKARMLKQLTITYNDNKPYGGAGIIRSFIKSETLVWQMTVRDKSPQKLEKKKKAILKFFNDQQKLISDYMDTQKLKYSSEKDLVKVFEYYNSL